MSDDENKQLTDHEIAGALLGGLLLLTLLGIIIVSVAAIFTPKALSAIPGLLIVLLVLSIFSEDFSERNKKEKDNEPE